MESPLQLGVDVHLSSSGGIIVTAMVRNISSTDTVVYSLSGSLFKISLRTNEEVIWENSDEDATNITQRRIPSGEQVIHSFHAKHKSVFEEAEFINVEEVSSTTFVEPEKRKNITARVFVESTPIEHGTMMIEKQFNPLDLSTQRTNKTKTALVGDNILEYPE